MTAKLEVRNDGIYILSGVTASYPHLDTANNMPGETDPAKAKFKLSALITIDDKATFDTLKKSCAVLVPKGKTVSKPPFSEVEPTKLPQAWTEAKGVSAYQVRFQNKAKPKCFDISGALAKEGEIKGGDLVSIAFQPFCFTNNFGTFLSLQLLAVRKIANDLEFGGNSAPDIGADAFGSVTKAAKEIKVDFSADPFEDEIPF